jgi:hypothetical protein
MNWRYVTDVGAQKLCQTQVRNCTEQQCVCTGRTHIEDRFSENFGLELCINTAGLYAIFCDLLFGYAYTLPSRIDVWTLVGMDDTIQSILFRPSKFISI